MNGALAGRMAVWSILIIVAYGLLILGIGRFLQHLGDKYPPLPKDP